jgi:voltage-gated potassium channel
VIVLFAVLVNTARRHQVGLLLALAAGCTLLGGGLFALTQHVGIGTGLYWAVTTATTVGYGDVTPHDTTGRIIAVGVMLTAIPLFGAVFAFLAAAVTAARLRRLFGLDRRIPEGAFVAIYGTSTLVGRLARALAEARTQVLVVADVDPEDAPPGVHLLRGDPTKEETVRRSRPERATRALVTAALDADVLVTAVLLRHLAPELPITAVTDSAKIARALDDLGVERTVSAEDLLGATLAKSLEAPHAGDLLLRLLDSDRYALREVPVRPEEVGQPLSALRRSYDGLVLGLVRDGEVGIGVATDPVVGASDALLVVVADEPPKPASRRAARDGDGGPGTRGAP